MCSSAHQKFRVECVEHIAATDFAAFDLLGGAVTSQFVLGWFLCLRALTANGFSVLNAEFTQDVAKRWRVLVLHVLFWIGLVAVSIACRPP